MNIQPKDKIKKKTPAKAAVVYVAVNKDPNNIGSSVVFKQLRQAKTFAWDCESLNCDSTSI